MRWGWCWGARRSRADPCRGKRGQRRRQLRWRASGAGIAATLGEAGVEIEPGEPLILRRQLKQDGGSRAYINDQPVSVALLREIAPFLVEIHGQHDDRGLVNPRGHRALLDRYVGHGVGVDAGAVETAWRRWRKAEEALSTARARLAKASEDRDLLLAHVAELATLAPEEGEEDELAAARADMQKGERLSGDLGELSHLFTGSDSALAQLRAAARRLDRIAGEHALLGEALESLDRAMIEAARPRSASSAPSRRWPMTPWPSTASKPACSSCAPPPANTLARSMICPARCATCVRNSTPSRRARKVSPRWKRRPMKAVWNIAPSPKR
jgi:DNA repair ATPase RecN